MDNDPIKSHEIDTRVEIQFLAFKVHFTDGVGTLFQFWTREQDPENPQVLIWNYTGEKLTIEDALLKYPFKDHKWVSIEED